MKERWCYKAQEELDCLVPVKTVQLGEPATLTCAIPKELSIRGLKWYKQSVGDTLKLIATLIQSKADFSPGFSSLRFRINNDANFSSLTILETVQEDEGHYHCTNTEWIGTTWSGIYLLVTGKSQTTSNYAVSQLLTEPNPVHPGDTMTLQCSVFSDSDKKTCPGGSDVLWFRVGSNKSLPNIIYTDRNRSNECEKRSDHQKTCVYRFSKNVSSSDAGTYYCAVATCGEILFGNGTTLVIQESSSKSAFIHLGVLIVCLGISVIGNVFLMCNRTVGKQVKGPGPRRPRRPGPPKDAADVLGHSFCLRLSLSSSHDSMISSCSLATTYKHAGVTKFRI
ncbi:signal-regulatory protein beta-2-like [Pelmatolapia mariae]|uniref:signal-regulatory protein beta-2-like n=1 Tax=Pelmatolapia mariae TaxID=158779 RepID=UPI003211E0F4